VTAVRYGATIELGRPHIRTGRHHSGPSRHEAGARAQIVRLTRVARDPLCVPLEPQVAGTGRQPTIRGAGIMSFASRVERVDRRERGIVARPAIISVNEELGLPGAWRGLGDGRACKADGNQDWSGESSEHRVMDLG
jgi:hypothetical protein